MRRQRDEMQVNVAGLRRNIKNLAHNYSDAQIKVREATSNDPWGPSSTIMSEIADLTYNVVAYTEIMQMVWKRLNDHGKNWRHVYKALVLLEYLIKTGSEKVAQQCKENIFAVQTLKDFQYMEEGKDKGVNVREKAKQLVTLLRDEERLRNERARALKAKERFAQSASAFGSDGGDRSPDNFRPAEWCATPPPTHASPLSSREMESARPQTAGEEELQLQLALAMSREEAEQEEQRRRSDDVRLQLALSQSQQDFRPQTQTSSTSSNMVDLLDVSLSDLGASAPPASDPWGLPPPTSAKIQSDPWNTTTSPVADPWSKSNNSQHRSQTAAVDPWAPASHSNTTSPLGFRDPANMSPLLQSTERPSPLGAPNNLSSPSSDLSEFDIITNRNKNESLADSNLNNGKSPNNNTNGNDPFDLGHLDDLLGGPISNDDQNAGKSTGCIKKTPQSFLGENSALVNLDNLIKPTPPMPTANPAPFGTANPFQDLNAAQPPVKNNLFQQQMQPVKPSMNQIKQPPFALNEAVNNSAQPRDPWAPIPSSQGTDLNSPWAPLSNVSRDTNNLNSPWTIQPARDPNSAWMKQDQQSVNPFLS
ncbi:epsin-2-like isoform X2 [Ctenocephalides felis]|uniref:epsin-2-like isoform X2 n=1 Tax=Ctenocephalides felis TaxID=7515 RepID=UPI000E6E4521|nr:epsin-2-like isoform X2 [Ctenocephalides felis]